MPVLAKNNVTKNYNNWRIKEFIVLYDEYKIKIVYGISANLGNKYEYQSISRTTIEGEDFAKIAFSICSGELSLKDNIKKALYQYLIDKGLIDNNKID